MAKRLGLRVVHIIENKNKYIRKEFTMPRGDKTGPAGQGPMTGRGMGYCAGYAGPGYADSPGRGMGRGFGAGRGRMMMPCQNYQPADEKNILESEKEALKSELEQVKDRLKQLESDK